MKIIFLTISFIILIGCSSVEEPKNISQNTTNQIEEVEDEDTLSKFDGQSYFDFDELEYYNIDFDIEFWLDKINQDTINFNDSIFIEVANSKTQSDTSFISHLSNIGYQKVELSNNKYDSINNIFTFHTHKRYSGRFCEPFYRDILIFKQKGKISGIAKICFSCNQNDFINSKIPDYTFGQNTEYQNLKELLGRK